MDEDVLIHPEGDPVVEGTWVSHFSRIGGETWGHVVRVGEARHAETMLDETVSDPGGDFQVYIDDRTGEDIAVTFRWGPKGPPVCHADFNATVVGSPTLPASHVARTSFVFTGAVWVADFRPRTWEAADKSWWGGPEIDDLFEEARRHGR